MLGGPSPLFRVARTEAIHVRRSSKVSKQDFLGFGAERHHPILAGVLRLVMRWAISPNLAVPINIAWAENAYFCRTHSCQSLNSHHVRNNLWQIRKRRLDGSVLHRADRRGFLGIAPPLTQSGDARNRVKHSRRDQLFNYPP